MPVMVSAITERLFGQEKLVINKKRCVYVSITHINLLVTILLNAFEPFLFVCFLAVPAAHLSVVSTPNILFLFQITSPVGPPHVMCFQRTKPPVPFMQRLQMKITPIIKGPGLL